jgi:hypothetical protein
LAPSTVTPTADRSSGRLEPFFMEMVSATPGPENSPGPFEVRLVFVTFATLAVTAPPKFAVPVIGTGAAVVPVALGTTWVMLPGVTGATVDLVGAACGDVEPPTVVPAVPAGRPLVAGTPSVVVAVVDAPAAVGAVVPPDVGSATVGGDTDAGAAVETGVDIAAVEAGTGTESTEAVESRAAGLLTTAPDDAMTGAALEVQPAVASAPVTATASRATRTDRVEEIIGKPFVVVVGSEKVQRRRGCQTQLRDA